MDFDDYDVSKFMNCNKYITLLRDVDNVYVCGDLEGIWRISVPSF